MATCIWVCLGLALGVGFVVLVIAADRTRFINRFDLSTWRDASYLRSVPNFLELMHRYRFESPWPWAQNAVATAWFRFRLRHVFRAAPGLRRRDFVEHHLTLFVLLDQLRPYLNDFIMREQQRILAACMEEMQDSADRDRLVGFMRSIAAYRRAFANAFTSFDHRVVASMVSRGVVNRLRQVHAVFREHGYNLVPEFEMLRRWEMLNGAELAEEFRSTWAMRLADGPPALPAISNCLFFELTDEFV